MQSDKESPSYKRWYDHDPLLVEVLETLRGFQVELRAQSEVFIEKITQEVGEEAVNQFYEKVKQDLGKQFGRRWYDEDPVVSRAVELLRVVPPETQRKAAQSFLKGLKAQGVDISNAPSQK